MSFNKYLPFENYTLTSGLSIDDIRKRIAENTEPKKIFRGSLFGNKYTKPYQGQISEDSFKIGRNMNYRNSFFPIVTGKLDSYLGETFVKIRMRPSTFVIVFMSF